MAGLYHFLPDVTPDQLAPGGVFDRDLLDAVGLGQVLAEARRFPQDAAAGEVRAKGPEGKAGTILYPHPPHGGEPRVYHLDGQEWIKAGPRYIGWDPLDPPTPEDLERVGVKVMGYTVADGAGGRWHVPVARSPKSEFGSLPTDREFGESGWTRVLGREYERLWTLAGDVWDYFHADTGAEPEHIDDDWLADAAVKVLAVNYRVGPWELTALRRSGRSVLDTVRIQGILLGLIDNDVVAEWAEKKTPTASPVQPAF